jgi:hypothetical protein
VPPAAEAVRNEPEDQSPVPAQWERMSNREIAKRLLSRRRTLKDKENSATQRSLSPFLPKYDDLTLFTLSATFLLLFLIHRNAPTEWELKFDDEWIVNVGLSTLRPLGGLMALAGVGMVASLFSVFFKRDKPLFLKYMMLCFAVLVTTGTGIYAGYITLKTTHGWLMIFPAWNILTSAVLLLMFRAGLVGADCITDEHASLWQVILSIICISILVAICHFGFNLHWTITYSICVCYTMSLNHTLTDLLGRQRAPQA